MGFCRSARIARALSIQICVHLVRGFFRKSERGRTYEPRGKVLRIPERPRQEGAMHEQPAMRNDDRPQVTLPRRSNERRPAAEVERRVRSGRRLESREVVEEVMEFRIRLPGDRLLLLGRSGVVESDEKVVHDVGDAIFGEDAARGWVREGRRGGGWDGLGHERSGGEGLGDEWNTFDEVLVVHVCRRSRSTASSEDRSALLGRGGEAGQRG